MRQYFSESMRRLHLVFISGGKGLNNNYDILLDNIARNVKRLRKENNMSQARLAIESDVDRTYIGYLENSKHNVSLKVLCQLALVFEVDVSELLSN